MAQTIVGYVAGAYVSMATINLNVPGKIRRIVAGFYVDRPGGVTGPPVALTPVTTANADNEVQIYTQTSIRIFIAAGLTNPIIFLLVETELEYPSKQSIPA